MTISFNPPSENYYHTFVPDYSKKLATVTGFCKQIICKGDEIEISRYSNITITIDSIERRPHKG